MQQEIKKILKKILPSPYESKYQIGFVNKNLLFSNNPGWYKEVQWVDTHLFDESGWFADPFFYELHDDKIILLAEQWCYSIGRGRLVKICINRNNFLLEDVYPILTLDTHLSFPNIWRENGKVYVYPENFESHSLRIWEFDGSQMTNPRVLVNEPLLDSQIIKINDDYFVLGVKYLSGCLNDTKDLYIWKSHSLLGNYKPFQHIHNAFNYERGAGAAILMDGKLIRPAQDCEVTYGKETILYELEYDGYKFSEAELTRIRPDKRSKYGSVLHTFNLCGDLCVIDGLKYRHPLVYKLVSSINHKI